MVGQARMLEKGLGPKADHGTKAGPAGREPTRAELMTPRMELMTTSAELIMQETTTVDQAEL